jgi:hypothetical protein
VRAIRSIGLAAVLLSSASEAQDWTQWGGNARHTGASTAAGRSPATITGRILIDPFAEAIASVHGYLAVHYPAVVVDGNELVVAEKNGSYSSTSGWTRIDWSIRKIRFSNGELSEVWRAGTDWRPVPRFGATGGPVLEPAYQAVLNANSVWAPGRGGTLLQFDRTSGSLVARINPFGDTIDDTIFVAGSPAVDGDHIYYNAVQLDPDRPWTQDVRNAWLVHVGPDESTAKVDYATLVPGAPAATHLCTGTFSAAQLPFPPSPDTAAPSRPCGSQRPAVKATPAIGPDGTVYVISRAHFHQRWGYLVAVDADLTPRWTASFRNRFHDGCGVLLPPNGAPGGCREGTTIGVDPEDNEPGSGVVSDDSTASPVVAPDGTVLYAAASRYNYQQGHLMVFSAEGVYLRSYPAGWDSTPAIHEHDDSYSILLKENHYGGIGSYCNDPTHCPPRSDGGPDPESYFITRLTPALDVEWQFFNPRAWSATAMAVDRHGTVYANNHDGALYGDRRRRSVARAIVPRERARSVVRRHVAGTRRLHLRSEFRCHLRDRRAGPEEARGRRAVITTPPPRTAPPETGTSPPPAPWPPRPTRSRTNRPSPARAS